MRREKCFENSGRDCRKDSISARLACAVICLFVCAFCFVCAFSGYVVSHAEETETILFCDGTNQGNPLLFNSYQSVGFRFEVPEGYSLIDFTLIASPTWGTQANAGFTADLYAWSGNYDESLSSGKLASFTLTKHPDNAPAVLSFGYVPAGQYLINIHSFTGNIGTWESIGLPEKYTGTWGFYLNGIEEKSYLPGTSITVAADGEPAGITPLPETEPPVSDENSGNETPEPTETPRPERTRNRITPTPGTDDGSDTGRGNGALAAGIITAVLAAAATAGVIVFFKKKDAGEE